MKKFLVILLCILSLFIASCSNDAKEPSEQIPEQTPDSDAGISGNAATFSFDKEGIKSIASAKVAYDIYSNSRAIEDAEEFNTTVLIYYDENDRMAPLAFKDAEGNFILFVVNQTYPLNDETFGVFFSNMYISKAEPELILGIPETRTLDESSAFIPELEMASDMKDYIFNGEMIVNTRTGKAVLLSNIDFDKFQQIYDSNSYNYPEEEYVRDIIHYDLSTAVLSSNDTVFIKSMTTPYAAETIYMISLDNPTEATPIINSKYFRPERIVAANSKFVVVKGSTDYNWGDYIIDLSGNYGPTPINSIQNNQELTFLEDGYAANINYYNLGNFEKELLIGDDFWNISLQKANKKFYKDANGNDIKHPCADGFFLAEDWIAPEDIKALWGGSIDFYPKHPTPDNNDPLYFNGDLYGIIEDMDHRPIKHPINTLKDGFYFDGKKIVPSEITTRSFTFDGNEYYYYFDNDGLLYSYPRNASYEKLFLMDENGMPIKSGLEKLNDGFLLKGILIKLQPGYSSNMGDFLDVTDMRGNEGYLTEQNGYWNASFNELKPRDKDNNPLNTMADVVSKGLFDYSNNKIPADYIDNNCYKINGVIHSYNFLDDGRAYTIETKDYPWLLNAARLGVAKPMKLIIDKTLVASFDAVVADPGLRLLNMVELNDSGIYRLYYYLESSAGNKLLIADFDTNGEETLSIKNIFDIGSNDLPGYEYSNLKNNYWSPSFVNMVWGDGGMTMYWLDINENTINKLKLETGEYDSVFIDHSFASNTLSRVGNKLMFALNRDFTEVGTYTLDCNDLHAPLELGYTEDVEVIPLVELNVTNI